MDTHSLRRIVEEIAAQVLGERSAGATEPRPLVLMTGTAAGLEVVLRQIERLQGAVGPMAAVLSESFREIVSPESFAQDTGVSAHRPCRSRAEAEALCGGASLVLVGTLSENSRAKMAAGIADSAPSTLWCAAREARLPVFIAEPPEPLAGPASPGVTPARLRQREEQMGVLREDGAEVIPAGEVFARVQRFLLERGDPVAAKRLREAGPRPIITVEDVERAHRRGLTAWALPKNAIVTAAAWDRARDLGVDLTGGNLP